MRGLSWNCRCWCDYENIMIMFMKILCWILFASDVDDGCTVLVAVDAKLCIAELVRLAHHGSLRRATSAGLSDM